MDVYCTRCYLHARLESGQSTRGRRSVDYGSREDYRSIQCDILPIEVTMPHPLRVFSIQLIPSSMFLTCLLQPHDP